MRFEGVWCGSLGTGGVNLIFETGKGLTVDVIDVIGSFGGKECVEGREECGIEGNQAGVSCYHEDEMVA